MKELHTFGWYAARVAPHLPKQAFKPVPSRLIAGSIHLFVAVTGILSIGWFDMHPFFKLAIAIIIGGSFASMGFLGHEILHGTVVRKAWLRNLLGAIAFWPLSTGPRLWRKWHNIEHHKHTQDEHLDPDAWPSMEKFSNSWLLRLVYRIPFPFRAVSSFLSLALTFSVHSMAMFKLYLKEFHPKQRFTVWLQMVLPWVTWIGLLFWLGFADWIFAFLIPLLIANFIVMLYISTNHRLNPLVPVNDPLANSLTVTVPRWVDALHFNFSYHTEHHLFPGLNPKYYPLVKEQIKRMWPERYHEMPLHRAVYSLWRTPRIYYRQDELVDPHRHAVYGSLGNGLNPEEITYRKEDSLEESSVENKNSASN
ncbi:fatty acid desaturase family protein [Desertibacillus haloalkaliphilus]|uniref:fatty acid desaturase family protein n=1 Tax=Desertibacillus haloalkaliphilus TaxID=1328930 RepID=UPI001C262302|nr:acyl-CoA desaturase [Desertibacillus haloalkaliphilus]MBU8905806.1 acyl-CoA desaturase [Desertibacillus haloalkaliphilus]